MTWILLGLNLLILCCLLWLSRAARAYSEEKGKNLATKEDITEITRKVESVRADFAAIRDARQHRHELSLAALDKRLAAHQTAYYLWRQILSEANKDDNFAFFRKCETWWEKHCLYLSPEAENAFLAAFRMGHVFKQFQGTAGGQKAIETITSAGDVIRKAAQLPGLGEEEAKSALAKAAAEGSEKA